MYTREEIEAILEIYDRVGTMRGTIREIGSLSPYTLRKFVRQRFQGTLPAKRPPRKPVRHQFSQAVKAKACRRCFTDGESVRAVAREHGVHPNSLYNWRKRLSEKGTDEDMAKKKSDEPSAKRKRPEYSQEEWDLMQEKMQLMQLQIDILNETLKIKKKPASTPRKT